MGYPNEKETRPSGLNTKTILIGILTLLFCIAVTALLTYFFADQHFRNRTAEETSNPTVPAEVDDGIPADELRLPSSIIPENYKLELKVFLPGYGYVADEKSLTFDGVLHAQLRVKERTNKITLNSVDLNIAKASVKRMDGTDVPVSSITERKAYDMIDIELEEEVNMEEIMLKIKYSGKIREDLSGFYQAKFTDDHGVEKVIAVTQFEPSDARKMVPCFDEPAMKANWTVSVTHPKGTVALGNGIDVSHEQIDRSFSKTDFKTTPKMSSYLLAICIADFDKTEKKTKSGVSIRIWARKDAKDQTKYALEAGAKVLEYYEHYYGIPFPLEKQDMVAIPDFAAGAMENWGLVTYREVDLLYDKNIFSPSAKLRVALVIAHELAHQWFGNLVTMEWWDDLWLNEGFATFVEHDGTKEISDGNFNMENSFVLDTQTYGFAADSVANSHPLSFKIDKVAEVREAFDSITYNKGGSVIRMLKFLMGEGPFREGLKNYLQKYSFSNAKAADLFTALNETSKDEVLGPNGSRLDIVHFAEQWIHQMGFPLVTVSRENVTHVKISQERFKINHETKDPEKYSKPKYGFKWDVPIWYKNGDREEFIWLPANSELFLQTVEPVVLNTDSKGFFRINYDVSEWKKISQALLSDPNVYSEKTKFRLLDDAFTMAKLGLAPYDVPLTLVQYIEKEAEYLPWRALKWSMDGILSYYGSEPERESIRKYAGKLFAAANVSRSWDFIASKYHLDEFYDQVELATMLKVSEAIDQEHPEVVKNMTELFSSQVDKKCTEKDHTSKCAHDSVPAPLRQAVYCIGVKSGGKAVFEKMMKWYRNEKDQKERSSLMRALGCVNDATLLKGLLINAIRINGSDIRLQDMPSAFDSVNSNPISSDFLLNFFIDRWDQIYKKGETTKAILSRVVKVAASNIFTRSQLKMYTNFYKSTPTTNDILAFKIGEEGAMAKVEWREKHFSPVSKMFDAAVKVV